MSNILQKKRAVVFGAGGSIGAAVAREFATEGAQVFLTGRRKSNVDEVAAQIRAAGGSADVAVLDALDDGSVSDYIGTIANQAGTVDIVFNAVGPLAQEYGNGKRAVDLAIEEFMVPLTTVVKSQFITARAAARQMMKQRSGVIIFLTGSPARGHVEGAAAIGAAFGAIETLMENMAVEISPHGVQVVCLRTTANTDSRTIEQTIDALAAKLHVEKNQVIGQIAGLNLLKTPACVSDTAKLAVLLACGRARLLTGTVVNATAGAAAD
jgi:NAD(P)-dependent dehydrogenase (short-subunit alcohol dehydrogenase family)